VPQMSKLSELLLRIRATAWVCAVRIGLWSVSFRTLQRIVGFWTEPVRRNELYSVDQLSRAVSIASRYVPQATCLTQAVALHILLKRGGFQSRVRIGVSKNNRKFESHAWVENQGQIVLGDLGLQQYTPMLDWD
jgi:hypothetical protein